MSSSKAQKKKQANPVNGDEMAQFVFIELRAGLGLAAFVRHSLQKHRFLQASRQKAGAIQAREVVLRFLSQSTPTRDQRVMIEKQLAQLQDCISNLEKLILANPDV